MARPYRPDPVRLPPQVAGFLAGRLATAPRAGGTLDAVLAVGGAWPLGVSVPLLGCIAALLDAADGGTLGTFTPRSLVFDEARLAFAPEDTLGAAYSAYVAPEQRDAARAGQYGLAVLARTLLDAAPAGTPAFGAPVDEVLRRAMHADPARRFPSATDFAAALTLACEAPAVTEPPVAAAPRPAERAGGAGPDGAREDRPFVHDPVTAPVPASTAPAGRRAAWLSALAGLAVVAGGGAGWRVGEQPSAGGRPGAASSAVATPERPAVLAPAGASAPVFGSAPAERSAEADRPATLAPVVHVAAPSFAMATRLHGAGSPAGRAAEQESATSGTELVIPQVETFNVPVDTLREPVPAAGARRVSLPTDFAAVTVLDRPGSGDAGEATRAPAAPWAGTPGGAPTGRPAMQQVAGGGPQYPAMLAQLRVSGSVIARFAVNARGWVDPRSVVIVQATNAQFAQAVRRALDGARYAAGDAGARSAPVQVEQTFRFEPPR